jgi:BirA family biotin operon repressor/biotin-[acetyl-CoA-carboxylase] ligase
MVPSPDSGAASRARPSVTADDLLRVLADGQVHSDVRLAERFGVARADVWKEMARLERWGLKVHSQPGRGYRLESPVELLSHQRLLEDFTALLELESFALFTEIPSTNQYLIGRPPTGDSRLSVCIAEYQSSGRGRRGRTWASPLGSGICSSFGWCFDESPASLAALPLAVGVCARRVLRAVAGVEITLKWPNDLVVGDRKLGGILVELSAEPDGRSHIVVGIGINFALDRALLRNVCDWPQGAIDLKSLGVERTVSRHALCVALGQEIGRMFTEFDESGFAPYVKEWRKADHLFGRTVSIEHGEREFRGTARGISKDAALLVDLDSGERKRFVSGDVRVRAS